VRENCTPGSVRGAPGNGRSYRDAMRMMNIFKRWEVPKENCCENAQIRLH
jgi:hypothetical protein